MVSSRSVNQPFGRNQDRVCVGEGGIIKKVAIPITSVISPLVSQARETHVTAGTTNEQQRYLLNEEQPSPTGFAENTTHMQYTVREEAGNNLARIQRHPKSC